MKLYIGLSCQLREPIMGTPGFPHLSRSRGHRLNMGTSNILPWITLAWVWLASNPGGGNTLQPSHCCDVSLKGLYVCFTAPSSPRYSLWTLPNLEIKSLQYSIWNYIIATVPSQAPSCISFIFMSTSALLLFVVCWLIFCFWIKKQPFWNMKYNQEFLKAYLQVAGIQSWHYPFQCIHHHRLNHTWCNYYQYTVLNLHVVSIDHMHLILTSILRNFGGQTWCNYDSRLPGHSDKQG